MVERGVIPVTGEMMNVNCINCVKDRCRLSGKLCCKLFAKDCDKQVQHKRPAPPPPAKR